ncbi:hypothetical protein SUGI_0087860 [Cryptomeria japonica]|nr:hypothetical protein SUGI_0087860 [Cryptomeria japonica]
MVLEVQDASEGLRHFCSRDIQWTPICVENDSTTNLCAAIPLGRLDAFIRGESLREGVETQFLRKRHNEHDSVVHNTHTTKMYSRYWCSYGPEDNRKKLSNKKCARTYQKKRGSTCHFIVKVLYGRPDVAILILKQPLHVDKNGEACHGVDDTTNELRSQFAPNLSDECKAYIERFLLMDVSIDAIMDTHLDDPIFHDMLKKRDSFVTHKDVMNAVTRVCSIRSRKHVHNATSILEWKKQDEANFFFFQQPQGADKPFIMGIQTTWMLDMMVLFSHDSIILMDLTFATNKYGVSLFELNLFSCNPFDLWMRRGKKKRPHWRINVFIMDDVSAEIQAIESVFECRVILCIWHMRRAWLKNVYKYGMKEREMDFFTI